MEEFFKEFKNDDVRFFIEFKGGGQELVKAVRDLVNAHGMYDRCTTIAFDTGDDALAMAEYPVSLVAKNLKDGMQINRGESSLYRI